MPNDNAKSKVTVLLNPEEFRRLDEFCSSRGHKKSTLIARLIREHLDNEDFRLQREFFPQESVEQT